MSKKVIKVPEYPSEVQLSKIKKMLGDHCACFVLITCSEPDKNGKMEVEMNYEGEEHLAAFLVENASQVFEQRMHRRESK